jgi:hypothetical protein
MSHQITLQCLHPDCDCEITVTYTAWPGSPGTRWDPPEPGGVEVEGVSGCYHMDQMEWEPETLERTIEEKLAEEMKAAEDRHYDEMYDQMRDAQYDGYAAHDYWGGHPL